MAKCNICNQEMLTAKGCKTVSYFLNNGKEVKPIPAGGEGWIQPGGTCNDCGAHFGNKHHTGCDIERCPECGGQFISCDCDYSDKLIVEA